MARKRFQLYQLSPPHAPSFEDLDCHQHDLGAYPTSKATPWCWKQEAPHPLRWMNILHLILHLHSHSWLMNWPLQLFASIRLYSAPISWPPRRPTIHTFQHSWNPSVRNAYRPESLCWLQQNWLPEWRQREYEVCETLWFWPLSPCFWALRMCSLESWSSQIASTTSMGILMVVKSKMTFAWREPSFQSCFHIGRCSSWPSGHGSQGRRRTASSLIRSKFGTTSWYSKFLDATSSPASTTTGWDRKQPTSIYSCHWWPHPHSTSGQYRIQNGLWDSSPTLFLRP